MGSSSRWLGFAALSLILVAISSAAEVDVRRAIPASGGMYGKRSEMPQMPASEFRWFPHSDLAFLAKRTIPLSGGVYGKRSLPMNGGMYGRRRRDGGLVNRAVPLSGGLYG